MHSIIMYTVLYIVLRIQHKQSALVFCPIQNTLVDLQCNVYSTIIYEKVKYVSS